jgi:hypothetical protein
MKAITRITPTLIGVIVSKKPTFKYYELHEHEFRNLQVEVAKGLWKNYSITYVGKFEEKEVTGTINPDGSLTQPLDVLNMNTDYQFELLKIKNCITV